MKKFLSTLTFIFSLSSAMAALSPISLPAPDTKGGAPLMKTLSDRKSVREFNPAPLSSQQLSDLLWAANGINRPDGHRTAPSAMNRQEIDIYMFTPEGVYLYDAAAHNLKPVAEGDHRKALESGQDFILNAPVILLLVADGNKFADRPGELAALMMAADAGIVCENINLFCSSAGLVTVPRASMDRAALSELLGLLPSHLILLNNPVSMPK